MGEVSDIGLPMSTAKTIFFHLFFSLPGMRRGDAFRQAVPLYDKCLTKV
jgi:hypothetical protein